MQLSRMQWRVNFMALHVARTHASASRDLKGPLMEKLFHDLTLSSVCGHTEEDDRPAGRLRFLAVCTICAHQLHESRRARVRPLPKWPLASLKSPNRLVRRAV